jgi:ferric-dicitrate binding protein FerR (iron transport regulator)
MLSERIQELARKYFKGSASPGEVKELHQWYDEWQDDEEWIALKTGDTEDVLRQRILASIKNNISFAPEQDKRRHFLSRFRYVGAAAAVLILIVVGALFLNRPGKVMAPQYKANTPVADVAAPGTSKATILLSDGSSVSLDGQTNGILAKQGNVKLLKTADGQISYQGNGNGYMQYNTLFNPRGSRVVTLTLSDGTRVWLNAESSLKYPVAFSSVDRKVEITGEAYFEVAHDASKPFRVVKGNMLVTVLGTHFNVNAYEDEDNIKVTLLEGSVKVSKGSAISFIKPGQQAKIASDLKIVSDVNIEEVMAWKNGKFQFGEASDIKTIMKEVARWYDLHVEYQGVITDHIGGTISRDSNVSQVLKKLELTGVVKFRINGNKIIVMPK